MKNIHDLLARLGLLCRLETAIVDKLDDHDTRLYALEENRKLKDQSILDLKRDVGELKLLLRQKPTV